MRARAQAGSPRPPEYRRGAGDRPVRSLATAARSPGYPPGTSYRPLAAPRPGFSPRPAPSLAGPRSASALPSTSMNPLYLRTLWSLPAFNAGALPQHKSLHDQRREHFNPQENRPEPTGEDVVVVEQRAPALAVDEVPKTELEGDRRRQPGNADLEQSAIRLVHHVLAHQEINQHQKCDRCGSHARLSRGLVAPHRLQRQFSKCAVDNRDRDHRGPCQRRPANHPLSPPERCTTTHSPPHPSIGAQSPRPRIAGNPGITISCQPPTGCRAHKNDSDANASLSFVLPWCAPCCRFPGQAGRATSSSGQPVRYRSDRIRFETGRRTSAREAMPSPIATIRNASSPDEPEPPNPLPVFGS